MGVGKYSPTVSHSYRQDQGWWEKNGGGYDRGTNPSSDNDDEGYDSYGYSGDGSGPDRAGITEIQYADHVNYHGPGDIEAYLYERVKREWSSLLCGTQHKNKYPAITGVVSQPAKELYVITSASYPVDETTVYHGYVEDQTAAAELCRELNKRSHRHGPSFEYLSIKPITGSLDTIYQAATEAG